MVVDFFLHAVGDVVEEGDDGVGGFGGGGVEEVAADAGGVELVVDGLVSCNGDWMLLVGESAYCYNGIVFHETLLRAGEEA